MNPIDQNPTTPARPDAEAEAKKAHRAEQSRINGAKSHGPTTTAGKAKSSKNSLKHGFAAAVNILIAPDDSDAWQIHLAGYRDSYLPTNYAENDFVDQIASIRWRQSRLVNIETALIDFQLSVQEEKVDQYFPDEAANSNLHLALAWQGLARKAYPRYLPQDPNVAPDPTQPPDGLDIESIELARRYQVSLDRQLRNTLLNFRQYRKDFAPTPSQQTVAEQNEPTLPQPKPPAPALRPVEQPFQPRSPEPKPIDRPSNPARRWSDGPLDKAA